MELNDYQVAITKFANPDQDHRDAVLMCAVGLSGEVGEVNELLKKHLFHKKPLVSQDLMFELGDVLWYLSTMARLNGFTMNDIAEANIEKLDRRQAERGLAVPSEGKPKC